LKTIHPTTVREIFLRLQTANPNPTTELVYHSSFELLISVILSAQATDISVNKATAKLYAVANTPETILALGLDGLKTYIKTIGLYNTKAVNILKTCDMLINQHQGQVPHDRAALESLAGVGRKTANVVLNTAFGEPTIAVDTHIFRVANRIGLAQATTVDQVEQQLLKVIPPRFQLNAHHWLILHGRYVCIARKPKCSNCLLVDICAFPEKNLV
jgi:endonuclease-3